MCSLSISISVSISLSLSVSLALYIYIYLSLSIFFAARSALFPCLVSLSQSVLSVGILHLCLISLFVVSFPSTSLSHSMFLSGWVTRSVFDFFYYCCLCLLTHYFPSSWVTTFVFDFIL